MDVTACNYDPNACIDDGSCEWTSCVIPGCTDPLSSNYNPLATVDDGSCIPIVVGPVDCQTIAMFGGGLEGCADVVAFNNGTSQYTLSGLIAHWYMVLISAGYTVNPDGSPITLQSVEILLGDCCGLISDDLTE